MVESSGVIEQINNTTYSFRMPCNDSVEVGDITSGKFEPYLKVKRWGAECAVGLLIGGETASEMRIPSDKLIEYETSEHLLQYHTKDYKLGGFAVDEVIFKKPLNRVVSASYSLDNIQAFYQPPLTPSEIADGCSRPEKVVGSYALYHATKEPVHASMQDAIKYKTCKIGMWYRPLIWDNATPKHYCWGEFSIIPQTGIRTITIPKEFYETATYPITIDDDFGYTAEGGSSSGVVSGWAYCTSFTTSGQAGETDSMSAYCKSNEAGDKLEFAIYEDDAGNVRPGVYGDETSEGDVPTPTNDIETQNLVGSYAIVDTTKYWLCININRISGTCSVAFDAGAVKNTYRKNTGYSTWPDPLGSGGFYTTNKQSIWVTYTPSGGTVVTPITVALTLTEYAPAIVTSVTVTPTTLALALTAYAPVIGMSHVVTPGLLVLLLTSYNSALHISIISETLELNLTTYKPTLGELIETIISMLTGQWKPLGIETSYSKSLIMDSEFKGGGEMVTNVFDIEDTVICSIRIKHLNGELYNPTVSMLISILDHNDACAVEDVEMTNDSTGVYHYDWQTVGCRATDYFVRYKATDGTRKAIKKDGIKLV